MIHAREKIISTFHHAVAITLEDMAFEQVDIIDDQEEIKNFETTTPDDTPPDTAKNEFIWAKIDLNEPLSGNLTIIMEQAYARLICEALFGFGEEDPTEDIIRDASAEMLNTIGGCFMKELIPPNQEYRIGFPETGMSTYQADDEESVIIYFKIGDHIIKGIICGKEFV